MTESSSGGNFKKIDANEGGLVWVNRRNGSWWPGQIMRLDELPQSCLDAQKLGTPVKLLGRKDITIDWYNLEKSRHVKPFRCGEYDEYIEEAKASKGHCSNNGMKYSRMKNAILHALELENSHGGAWKVCLRTNNSAGAKVENSAGKLQIEIGPRDVTNIGSNSMPEVSFISSEHQNLVSASQVHISQKMSKKIPNDLYSEVNVGTKRMRGYQGLGLREASKEKSDVHYHTEGTLEVVLPSSSSVSESNCNGSVVSGSPISMDACLYLKRKCSHMGNTNEIFKKKNKHRPLAEVLECTAKVDCRSVGGIFSSPAFFLSSIQCITEDKSIVTEATESRKASFSLEIHDHSHSTGISVMITNDASDNICVSDVCASHSMCHSRMKSNDFTNTSKFPDNDIWKSSLNLSLLDSKTENEGSHLSVHCESGRIEAEKLRKQPSHCVQDCSLPLNAEGFDETASSVITTNLDNLESKLKEELNGFDGNADKPFVDSLTSNGCSHLEKREMIYRDKHVALPWNVDVSRNWFSKRDMDTTITNPLGLLRNRAQISSSYGKSAFEKSKLKGRINKQFPSVGCFDLSVPCLESLSAAQIMNTSMESALFNVELNVRASYLGQHVPLVSLMSKLDGKAIIGHPISVEVLEEGLSDQLIPGANCYKTTSSSKLYDVPIKSATDQLMGIITNSILLNEIDEASKLKFEAACLALKDQRNVLSINSNQSPVKRKKLPKMRKRRKLSVIAINNEPRVEERKLEVEKWERPIMSCVPLKLVFSRMKEALNLSGRSACSLRSIKH